MKKNKAHIKNAIKNILNIYFPLLSLFLAHIGLLIWHLAAHIYIIITGV
jgi:hypothetical protein